MVTIDSIRGARLPYQAGARVSGAVVQPGTTDSVHLSGAQPPAMAPGELWTELARIGLLSTAPAASGPIGVMLTEATTQGLIDCVTRIQAHGKVFHDWNMSLQASLPPEQVVDRLARQPTRVSDSHLVVSGFNVNAVLPLNGLEELRGLDVVHGAGLSAAAPEVRACRQSLDDLAALGWTFGESDRPTDAAGAFEYLNVPLFRGRGLRAVAPDGSVTFLDNAEHVTSFNYFNGSRQDRGMLLPARAQAVQLLRDRGMLFRDLYTEENADLSCAYARHDRGYAGRSGHVMLPLDEAATSDVPRFERRLAMAENVVAKLFATGTIAPSTNDTDWYVGKALHEVLQDTPPITMQQRVDAMLTLATAELRRQPRQALFQIIAVAHDRLQRLAAVTRSPLELLACTQALGEMIAATPPEVPPYKVVDDTMLLLTRALAPPAADAPRVERGKDNVVIGGIRIPRRRTGQTAAI